MDKNEITKETRVNNEIIGSTFEKSSMIIKLVYEIDKGTLIKLFGKNFFELNKKRIKIINNNKLCNLKNNYMKISHNNIKVLKMKLLILNSYEINFSQMFNECDSLNEFSIIIKNEPNLKNQLLEEQKNNQIDSLSNNKESYEEIFFFNNSNNETKKISDRA